MTIDTLVVGGINVVADCGVNDILGGSGNNVVVIVSSDGCGAVADVL